MGYVVAIFFIISVFLGSTFQNPFFNQNKKQNAYNIERNPKLKKYTFLNVYEHKSESIIKEREYKKTLRVFLNNHNSGILSDTIAQIDR